MSPNLFIIIAFIADLLASGLAYQKFINKNEDKPIPSHPIKSWTILPDVTIKAIKKVKIVKYAKNLLKLLSPHI